jgi:hypothetical protein
MSGVIFNPDGTISRQRKQRCKDCGAMWECDICWEHVRDWSPFVVLHCFICRMPQARFDGGGSAMLCEWCGADEAEFSTKKRPAE